MFDESSTLRKVVRVIKRACYALGFLGVGTALGLTPFGGALALQGWVFGGLVGILLFVFGYWLSGQTTRSQGTNVDPADLPPELVESWERHGRNSKICFGVAGIVSPIALGLLLVGGPALAFGAVGLVVGFIALILGLASAWERVRLQRRYQRLRQEYLVHWTYSAGSREGQEVFIGLDSACLDGVLIEWNGYSHVLTDIAWLEGTTMMIEFRVARHNPKTGYLGDDTLQIPVPEDYEEAVRSAIDQILNAPATGWTILVWTIQGVFAIVAVAILAFLLASWLGIVR